MHTSQEYRVTLFLAGEDGERPFKSEAFAAPDDAEAKIFARRWVEENKPQLYQAVEIRLRCGETEIWSSPIDDHGFPVVAGR
jgi:hypothetical protein